MRRAAPELAWRKVASVFVACVPVACVPVACVLLACGALACNEVHTGSPVLIGARWKVNEQTIETLNAGEVVVPPAGTRFELVFDRRLDGNKIEDGSQGVPRPRADPPVHLAFDGQPTGYALTVVYASNGSGGPSIWVSPTSPAAYPAGKVLTFSLDRSAITGTDGTLYTGPAALGITTAPFGVDLLVPPSGTASAAASIPISFNNPPSSSSLEHHLHVLDGAGHEVPTLSFVDNRNRQLWNLQAACAGGWPVSQELTVVVDPAVTDLYGSPLLSEARATFTVAAGDASGGGACPADSVDAGLFDAASAD